MPIALLFALALAQAAPDAPAAAAAPAETQGPSSPEDIAAAGVGSLPKDDYGLVAWCHGAVAGQLELDPIAHADMVSIEGKAKVAARAKSDAEMEKDRREYLHDYERALAAAEKASPTAIHQYGVESEVAGYKLWALTRQKAPIWRMLDWGMWDPNDAGCGDAAKRLYNRSSLFSEALKGPAEDKTPETKAEPAPPPSAPANEAPAAAAPDATPTAAVTDPAPTPTPDAAAPEPVAATTPLASKPKTTKARTAKVVKAKAKASASTPPAAAPASPPDAAPSSDAPPATDQHAAPAATPPAPPADGALRGPQA